MRIMHIYRDFAFGDDAEMMRELANAQIGLVICGKGICKEL